MLPPAYDILQEISLVLQAMRKNNHDSCPSVTKATLNDFVLNVIHQTKDNSCSMREDVKNGRKTEIEYLNGYIVECGRNFNVPTLVNSDIRDQIQRMNTAK
uniref:Ketopantoate reductase C-terminal domain-containing protein n=1 Tax=Proboscia inermis TaxID=420281 RepID=A0A7S0GM20_9STRA|mmetsp:Transcript_9748/g.9845  ORF Transcript_9748/g.9845 Transcript_9748/m.9845 type:complete len:101 (+) Transcript_9748:1-303(+)